MALNSKKPLIFVVEDNQVYNRLVVSFLKTNGYIDVEAFLSGEDVLKAIETKEPAIVIQDYLLGGISGIEVLKATKAKYPNVEFIFLSGNDSIEVAINTMKYGAYDYIVKDQVALKKMVTKINRIEAFKTLEVQKKGYKKGIILFFSALLFFVILVIVLVLAQPQDSGWSLSRIFNL
ncbi:MAG: response regulator [Mangrovibacterium sp.]